MLLMVICLTRANLEIRTYPDFGLRIMGFFGRGCLYMSVGRRVTPVMVRPAEAARILVKTELSQIFQIVADLISISCVGLCGGDDFSC